MKKYEPKKEERKGGEAYIFLGIIVLAVVRAGYYFKIYKKKQKGIMKMKKKMLRNKNRYKLSIPLVAFTLKK